MSRPAPLPRCKVCRCTETEPCEALNGPCCWSELEPDLCSVCEDAVKALVDWHLWAHKPKLAPLMGLVREGLRAQVRNLIGGGKK